MLKTIQIAGIQGDCEITGFEGWIQVQSIDFEVRGTAHIPGISATEHRAGKAACGRVRLMKNPDKSSALLFKNCVKGDTLNDVKIVYSTHSAAGTGNRAKVMEITLTGVKVANWDLETLPAPNANENFDAEYVAFSFKEIRVESFSVEGAAAGAVTYNEPKGIVT